MLVDGTALPVRRNLARLYKTVLFSTKTFEKRCVQTHNGQRTLAPWTLVDDITREKKKGS